MRTYHVHSASPRLVYGIAMVLAGLCFGLVDLVGTFHRDGDGVGLKSVFFALFTLAWLWGGITQLRSVREIVINSSGTIEFLQVIGATRIAARDIRELEGKYERDYDGDPVWQLRVHHHGGRLNVDSFRNAQEFVDQVLALNPTVAIAGLWPMADLPPPPVR